MKSKMDIIERILKNKDIKLTKQRKEIIQVFLNNDKHFKPEDIYQIVKKQKIGLATVYRTIEILKNNGIIKEITLGKDRYYEQKIFSEKCLHIHFRCEKCNRICDYDEREMVLSMMKLKNDAEEMFGVEIKDVSIMMSGICNKCRG